jgi:hypothetical protein
MISYEVGTGVNIQKMPGRKGGGLCVFEKVIPDRHM